MLTRTPTRWHIFIPLNQLQAMSDSKLAEILTGGSVAEIRQELTERYAAGQRYFTGGDCDNQHADGRCAGHPIQQEDTRA